MAQVVAGRDRGSLRKMSAACAISRSAAGSSSTVRSPSLLRSIPVTGSVYGSAGAYGRRYRETVLRYSSAAVISPSTYADTSR